MTRLVFLVSVCLSSMAVAADKVTDDANSFIRSALHLSSFKTTSVDLDGDGNPEVLVYANERQACGSGGCDLHVLTKTATGYRVVTTISVTRLPVRILSSSSHGWRDLGVMVAGGGIIRGYEARLKFDGKSYASNPTTPPAERLNKVGGRIILQ